MLIAEYNKKISKYLAFYRFIYKYRILLTTIGVMLSICSGTLMGITGIVYQDLSVSDVSYGEDYNFEAKGIFQNPRIQYSQHGSDQWSYDKPLKAGSYQARVVSQNIFGSINYGKPHGFNIFPLEIKPKIENNSFVYGENPNIFFDNLAYGDTLAFRDFELINVSKNPQVKFDDDDFIIVNSNGNDVTRNYSIDLTPIDVTLIPRDITFTVNTNKIYDGEVADINNDNLVIKKGSLAKGDTFKVDLLNEDTNIGVYTPEVEFDFSSSQYGDVTKYYKASIDSSSSLEITRRNLEIELPNYTKVYDGKVTTLTASDCKLGGDGLANGDSFNISFNQYLNAGTYQLEILNYSITNKNGEDVTNNYSFDFTEGTYTIEKRDITVSTPSSNFVYDGLAHSANDFKITSGSLAENETIEIATEFYTPAGETGTFENKTIFNIINADNTSTLNNYNVTYEYGTIEIQKQDLKVSSIDLVGTYNGANEPIFNQSNSTLIYDESKLASTDQLVIDSFSSFANYRAGVYENANIFNIRIEDKATGEDRTDNYNITYVYGDVTINPLPISLSTGSATFYYKEGEEYSLNEIYLAQGNIAFGDILEGGDEYTIVSEIGTYENEVEPLFTNSQGNDVTDCYYVFAIYKGQLQVVHDPNEDVVEDPTIFEEPSEDILNGDTETADSPISLVNKGNSPNVTGPDSDHIYSDENNYLGYFTFNTDFGNRFLYFRQNVYGNYSNGQIYNAPKYNISSLGINADPNLYLSKFMDGTKYSYMYYANLSYHKKFSKDLAPYYPNYFPYMQSNDNIFKFTYGSNYSIGFYDYNFLEDGLDGLNYDKAKSNQNVTNYKNFVFKNYLFVPESLNQIIDHIIDYYQLRGKTEFETIYNVARYMTTYNEKTDEKIYQPNTDVILEFLSNTHKGMAGHFSTATAMILRRLGIPARMASGYIAFPLINETNIVDQANVSSWTEVFSTDLNCWVSINTFPDYAIEYTPGPAIPEEPVEPPDLPDDPNKPNEPENPDKPNNPGGGNNQGGEGTSYPRDPITEEVTIISPSKSYVYDGLIHTCDNNDYTFTGNLLPYDELRLTYYSKIQDAGKEVLNKFSYKIYDTRNNKDVTREYEGHINVSYGTLTVSSVPLEVASKDLTQQYNGMPLYASSVDDLYFGENNLKGEDKITKIVFYSRIVYPGQVENRFEIKEISRPGSRNCIINYDILYTYGTLTIT